MSVVFVYSACKVGVITQMQNLLFLKLHVYGRTFMTPAYLYVFKLEEETIATHVCMYLTKQKATTNLFTTQLSMFSTKRSNIKKS